MTVGVYFNPDIHGKIPTQRSATCIIFSIGRKFKHAVAFGATIRCVEIELENTLRPVMYKGAAYPIAMAAQRYLNAGMTMTERAEKVLRNLIANEPIEEPTTPDEEKPNAVAAASFLKDLRQPLPRSIACSTAEASSTTTISTACSPTSTL